MNVEKLNAEKAERENAIKQLIERDQVLVEELRVRNQERSQIKVQYDQQQGALAQLNKLLEIPAEAEAKAEEAKPAKADKK